MQRLFPAFLVVSILLSLDTFAFQNPPENRTITGQVKSAETGIPLSGVSVAQKGLTRGIVTDSTGRYQITVPDNAVLVFSFVGLKTIELPLDKKSFLDVYLEKILTGLKDVVVIGYGKQSRDQVTGAISKMDNKVLENVPYANIESALQGSVSGVQVQTTSGQPGAAPQVVVRGGTSINNPDRSSPLYVVDGVIRSDIDDLNAADVESIQVLKDAASTAIYGARASNGVVIVVTKTGKAGQARISYSYDLTSSKVAKLYNTLSARDYIYYQRTGIAASASIVPSYNSLLTLASSGGTGNDLTNSTAWTTQYLTPANQYKLNEGWESMPDPVNPSKKIIFKGTDFQNLMFQTALSNNHNLSVSGGSDKSTYIVGAGYMDNAGIAITSRYKRFSFNLGNDFRVKDNIKVYDKLIYSTSSDNEIPNLTATFGRSMLLPPTAKYEFEDGTLAPGINNSIGNPVYIVNSQNAKNSKDNLTMIAGMQWDLLPGLSFEPQASFYKLTTDSRYFQKAFLNGVNNRVTSRYMEGNYSKQTQIQADAIFSYNHVFNKAHTIDVKAGYSYFQTDYSYLFAAGVGASSDLVPTLDASAQPYNVNGYEWTQVIISYFGRINYDYKQKYLLSLNARYDGASNLGADHKWGFFPGISAGWNLHKENFWTAMPTEFSSFKLRASYGVNGNIGGLGPYEAQGQYAVGGVYNGNAAVTNTSMANQDLEWERSRTVDLGTDLGFFNNRLTALVDVYDRTTDHLLTNLNLPLSTGFSAILTNYGTLQNKGIEVELKYKVMNEKNPFQWDVALNISKVKTTIMKLPQNGIPNNRIGGEYIWDSKTGAYVYAGGLQEGGRIGDIFAYKQKGIYSTDQEAAGAPTDMIPDITNKTKHGGDVNWLDADNNGVIDSRDRVYVGNQYPTLTGGIMNNFSYKHFSLYVRMDYTTGQTIYNYVRASMLGQFQGENGLSKHLSNSWQKQGDKTDIPKFYWADQNVQSNLYRGNSTMYEKGDFIALREVTLVYVLQQKALQKVGISAIRFHITGSNLYYFTKYKGLSPELGGNDYGRYPVPRNLIVGASITF